MSDVTREEADSAARDFWLDPDPNLMTLISYIDQQHAEIERLKATAQSVLPWDKSDSGAFGDWLYQRLREMYGKDPTIGGPYSTDEVERLIETAFQQENEP